jgi:hypothetical protein
MKTRIHIVAAGLALALIVTATAQASSPVDEGPPAAEAPSPDTTGPDGSTSATLPTAHEGLASDDEVLVEFGWSSGWPGLGTSVTVRRNGTASESRLSHGRESSWSFTLYQSRLERLESALIEARFPSLRSSYRHDHLHCHDCSSYWITYEGREVSIYWPRPVDVVPARLTTVFSLLSNLQRPWPMPTVKALPPG